MRREATRHVSGLVKHWTTKALAEQLGIDAKTLRRAKNRGELRPIRTGRDLLWPEPDVLEWLELHRVPERRRVA